MTHASNKARRNKLRRRQNAYTSANSTKVSSAESSGDANSSSTVDKNNDGNSNGRIKISTTSDIARVEIGPW